MELELHYARHALTLLYFVIWNATRGELISRSTVGGVIYHLVKLKIFANDPLLNDLIKDIGGSLQIQYDQSLNVMVKNLYECLRCAARLITGNLEGRLHSNLTLILVAASNQTTKNHIYMREWLIDHQSGILKFAEFFGRKNMFESLFQDLRVAHELSVRRVIARSVDTERN